MPKSNIGQPNSDVIKNIDFGPFSAKTEGYRLTIFPKMAQKKISAKMVQNCSLGPRLLRNMILGEKMSFFGKILKNSDFWKVRTCRKSEIGSRDQSGPKWTEILYYAKNIPPKFFLVPMPYYGGQNWHKMQILEF